MVGGCRQHGQLVGAKLRRKPSQGFLSPGGELIMWSQWMMDSWGYGGYGPIRTIIWIILVIAIVAGIVWRVVRAQQKKSNSQ